MICFKLLTLVRQGVRKGCRESIFLFMKSSEKKMKQQTFFSRGLVVVEFFIRFSYLWNFTFGSGLGRK